jgi:hypothetical protein
VNSDPADFFFVHINGKGLYMFKPNNNVTAEMHIDYDQNGAMSMGCDFMQMSWSYDYNSTVGITSQVTEVPLKSVKQAGGAFQHDWLKILYNGSNAQRFRFDKCEVWVSNTASTQNKPSSQALQDGQKSTRDRALGQVQSVPMNPSDNHPWIKQLSPMNLFRARPVFFVPSHLSIRKATEILMLLSNEQTSIQFTSQNVDGINMEEKIQSLYERYLANPRVA